MKRSLIIPVLTAVIALGVAAPAYARGGTDDTTDDNGGVAKTAEDTVNNAEDSVKSTSDDLASRLQSQKDRIEARKAELEKELEQKKQERKEKLEGRRLAQCQNRQDNINSLLDKSASIGKARLARIKAFEDGIKSFYEKQQLSSTDYDAALQAADAKQAAATAALEVIDTQTFSCDQVDGAKPSDTIKTTIEAKRTALKEYRDSVQELLKVVRQAFVAKAQGAQQ